MRRRAFAARTTSTSESRNAARVARTQLAIARLAARAGRSAKKRSILTRRAVANWTHNSRACGRMSVRLQRHSESLLDSRAQNSLSRACQTASAAQPSRTRIGRLFGARERSPADCRKLGRRRGPVRTTVLGSAPQNPGESAPPKQRRFVSKGFRATAARRANGRDDRTFNLNVRAIDLPVCRASSAGRLVIRQICKTRPEDTKRGKSTHSARCCILKLAELEEHSPERFGEGITKSSRGCCLTEGRVC
jgi:hypothetical protein